METLYLTLIIIFIILAVASIGAFLYFKFDEKNIKEIDTNYLSKMGKNYTKEEIEAALYNLYIDSINCKENEDYNKLKDIISDELYNKTLLEVKDEKEHNIKKITTNISKGFTKLIGLKVVDELEVAKLWVQYSSIEYTEGMKEITDENEEKKLVKEVISGSETKPVFHEYILTFVKRRSNNEEVVCPNCGSNQKILLSSKCSICDNIMVPKSDHWVYVSKEVSNISRLKKD